MFNIDPTIVEIFGVTAGALVLISFLMKGERNIRLINIIGSVIFIVYGVMIGSLSVTLLNVGLTLVHIVKLSRKGETEV
ncbi:YgjV family protein [Paracholeplasma manati]|uniref:YgjV family protein n=1 Tax=Paracholeplasma manati TaxID=591373 RepID=A0ABT2Y5W8_9MOLU|nr:YgjV family protein [Paracholeplasma manati]MCV2232137.1 YgjV family protein [Paracholeplasma manati]MDG0888094.1 YgjV family protein [Paracholeplasma manati]MDX9806979.1 YgjV family protein [Acholeplasma sp.]